jgi:DNA-binding NarL/FixJ family response regulator
MMGTGITQRERHRNAILDMQGVTDLRTQERIHVMLVEDSVLIRQALTDALSSSGVALFDGFASTSQEAIAILRSRRFDMIVVDIELSHGTGFDVLQEINKADFPYPPPISMVLTNHAYVIYRHRANALGVKYFFDKSMHFDEAIEAIETEARNILIRNTNDD